MTQRKTGKREIKVVETQVKNLKNGFGNPRKIKDKKRKELAASLDTYGDFGLFLVDEDYNLIAGNQRWSVLMEKDPETTVTCKMLCGYSEAELRAINIKDNTHSGEWDLDLLADWTADLVVDIGIDVGSKDIDARKNPKMELLHYEKYDYVMLVCRNELDYDTLVKALGIEGAKVDVTSKRSIKARAVWYDTVRERLFGNGALSD